MKPRLNRSLLAAVLSIIGLPTLCWAGQTDTVDRKALLNGVDHLMVPGGLPGDIVVSSPAAFTICTGKMGGAQLPLFAGARYNRGRIVAGGHEGFFGSGGMKYPGNQQFAKNITAWLAGNKRGVLHVTLVDQSVELSKALSEAGVSVVSVRANQVAASLAATDVLWLNQASLDRNPDAADAVRAWVSAGGGLCIAGPAWGWQSTHPGKSLFKDHSGNRILISAGLGFAGGELAGGRRDGFNTTVEPVPDTSAAEALADLKAMDAGSKVLTKAQLAQVTTVLGQAIDLLERGPLTDEIEQFCKDRGSAVPTIKKPITAASPFARLSAVMEVRRWKSAPPEAIKAHPAAAEFPGPVPADARRVTRELTINSSVPEWHSTGLYAAPGEVVSVKIPSSMEGRGLGVRIGSHTDTLWNLDSWQRFPEISMYRPLRDEVTKVASPFGGAIFIVIPENAGLEKIDVTISGAVQAPHFVRGVTTNQEWNATQKNAPAPWAELEGKKVILSVPSYAVRNVTDAEALMAYWDEVMDNVYALYAAPLRNRPERYCVDRQISAGYMHSGYPIMTWEDVANTFCDLNVLRGNTGIKCWGFYHEMGHNFQRPAWTWESFGEVTNNLFSLYGTEVLNGVKVGAHPSMTAEAIAKRVAKVAGAPGAEAYYSSDPWYPLTMFWLMRQEFGWKPYTALFAEFAKLPRNEQPKTEQEKHDQFLVRFSRLTGRNLTQYLKAWGVELSSVAIQKVSDLPTWMPQNWK
jgi:Peptidase M60, enhancin and enhancin-like/N-terminal domain of M60-like peptidases